MNVSDKPALSPHLLWEYDLNSFDFDRSKKVVIERVIERGNMSDWRVMLSLYGKDVILAVSRKSKQLSTRDKQFTEIFVHSGFLNEATHK